MQVGIPISHGGERGFPSLCAIFLDLGCRSVYRQLPMATEYINEIRALADKCSERDTTVYLPDFDAEPNPSSLNRIGGPPFDLESAEQRFLELKGIIIRARGDADMGIIREEMLKTYDGTSWDGKDLRMQHLFTIDLAGDIGKLIGAPADKRAMSLFIGCRDYNEAMRPGNGDIIVLFLGEEDCARGYHRGKLSDRCEVAEFRTFSMIPVQVSGAIFTDEESEGNEETKTLNALRTALFNAPAYLGGKPTWIQGGPGDEEFFDDGEESDDEEEVAAGFVMQFNEKFVSVNLGGSGIMYMFGNDTYRRCY